MSGFQITVTIAEETGTETITVFEATEWAFEAPDPHGRFTLDGVAREVNGYWGTENGQLQGTLATKDYPPPEYETQPEPPIRAENP